MLFFSYFAVLAVVNIKRSETMSKKKPIAIIPSRDVQLFDNQQRYHKVKT